MMDIATGPAALGGMMMGVALGAWMLGRWQGGVTPAGHGDTAQADDSAAATPGATANLRLPEAEAGPCRTAARAERYSAIATAESLGAIHAEITAYRRAEQVLSGPELGASRFSPRMEAAQAKCRYAGLPGEPVCGLAPMGRATCSRAERCGRSSAQRSAARALQPSAPSDLTRV